MYDGISAVNRTFQTRAPGSLVLNRVSRPRTPFPKLCSTEIVGVLVESGPWRPLVLTLSYANSIKGASKLAVFVSYASAVLYAEEDLASAAGYVMCDERGHLPMRTLLPETAVFDHGPQVEVAFDLTTPSALFSFLFCAHWTLCS